MNYPVVRFSRALSLIFLMTSLMMVVAVAQTAPSEAAPAAEPPDGKRPIRTAKKHTSFSRHSDFVSTVAFSPDGKRIASAGDNRLKVTEIETGKELWTLKPTKGMSFFSLAFSPDGSLLVAGQSMLQERTTKRQGDLTITKIVYQGEVLVWDAQTGALKGALYKHGEPAWTVAFSPDGKLLAMGTGPTPDEKDRYCEHDCDGSGEIMLWETGTWTLVRRLRGSRAPIRALAFSPDGRKIAGGAGWVEDWGKERIKEGDESGLMIWDTATGELKHTLPGHLRPITSIAYSPDGNLLASASKDRGLKIWDAQTYELKTSASEYLLSFEELQTLHENAGDKDRKKALPSMSWLTVILFSRDGQSIIGGGGDSIIRFYSAESGKLTQILQPRDWPVIGWRTLPPSFSRNDPFLAGPNSRGARSPGYNEPGSITSPVADRRLSLQMMMQRWPKSEGTLNAMALSRDGQVLATGNADGKIRLMVLD